MIIGYPLILGKSINGYEVTEQWASQSSNQLETLNRLRMTGYGVSKLYN